MITKENAIKRLTEGKPIVWKAKIYDPFRDDEEVAFIACTYQPKNFPLTSQRLREDREFCWKVCKEIPTAIEYMPELANDKTFIMNLLAEGTLQTHFFISKIGEALKDDEEVILTAMEQSWGSYSYASQRLKAGLDEACQELYGTNFLFALLDNTSRTPEIIKAYKAKQLNDKLQGELSTKPEQNKPIKNNGGKLKV